MNEHEKPVALITGSARRIGKVIVEHFHEKGYRVIVHYRQSHEEAKALVEQLSEIRSHSAIALQADLSNVTQTQQLIPQALNTFGRLDVLVNNASSFYPTPIGEASMAQWNDLFASNCVAPFFLAQAAMDALSKNQGAIINIVDIHGHQPLRHYPIYCAAKAGLVMLTKSLAKELGPSIRVNGVAPGNILWPEGKNELTQQQQQQIINKTTLKRSGTPDDIAKAVLFLVEQPFITGQVLTVDGGRL